MAIDAYLPTPANYYNVVNIIYIANNIKNMCAYCIFVQTLNKLKHRQHFNANYIHGSLLNVCLPMRAPQPFWNLRNSSILYKSACICYDNIIALTGMCETSHCCPYKYVSLLVYRLNIISSMAYIRCCAYWFKCNIPFLDLNQPVTLVTKSSFSFSLYVNYNSSKHNDLKLKQRLDYNTPVICLRNIRH